MKPKIEANHLTKEYQLGHSNSLKETALNTLRPLAFRYAPIEQGKLTGIIGHNGK